MDLLNPAQENMVSEWLMSLRRIKLESTLTLPLWLFARFQVEHILSEPSDGWGGRTGRVDAGLLRDFLVTPEGSRSFACVCGPSAFTDLTVRCVKVTPVLLLFTLGWKRMRID